MCNAYQQCDFVAQIRELQSKLGLKDNYIVELKSKLQLMNENSARQTALITVSFFQTILTFGKQFREIMTA